MYKLKNSRVAKLYYGEIFHDDDFQVGSWNTHV